MSSRPWRLVARGIAIAIAIAAVIDPAAATSRAAKPIVAVVAAHARDSAFAGRVAAGLAKQFVIVRAPLSAASGTVVVGDNLPPDAASLARPTFAVLGDRSAPVVKFERVVAPATTPLAARVSVSTDVHVVGARGRTLELALRSERNVIDRVTRTIRSDDERVSVPLTFVPTVAGAALLRIHASLGGADTANADVGVDVRDAQWAVLVYDPRPSWMSTFVRRALERDPRFVVTSRVVTSRNISTDVGQPARLDDMTALGLFDAVVIGAPEALSDRDVQGIDAFLRRRGGSAVLLLDRRAPGPYEQLVDVSTWATDSTGKAETIAAGPVGDSLRAAELAWPARLADGASTLASTRDAAHPVVWSQPVGAGRLIVSGALDAWRFRDPAVSSFDRFWQHVVADAAAAAPPPVAVTASQTVAAPGEQIELTAAVRDVALSTARPVRASATAALMADARATPMRVWPGNRVGTLRGTVRAPTVPGNYRLTISANGARGDAPLLVEGDAAHPQPETPDLLRAWVASRGGSAIAAADVGSLAPRMLATIHAADRRMTWHPMRSAWWILPFAVLLSLEWWLRRRRGLL